MKIGMNGRFFPQNWRPAVEEITFARRHGFEAIQFRGSETGLGDHDLGASLADVAGMLREANIEPVMEIMLSLNEDGRTNNKLSPCQALQANLKAITTLGCTCVHWHLVARKRDDKAELDALEEALYGQFERGVALAVEYNFALGIEHNEPGFHFFACPERLKTTLQTAPGLNLVLDLNHVTPENRAGFMELVPAVSMLHLSDTPLPQVNYHLPIGEGAINFGSWFQVLEEAEFNGPAILEIGGTPKSGGYGKDTDTALIVSQAKLQQVRLKGA